MPEGPWLYPEDEVSDATDRMIAAELTREQIFNQLHQELPYASAIETESWEDRQDGSTVIHQQIFVERDSQKAIVIGKGGSRLADDRRKGARGNHRASRPESAPVPAREGQPALGRGPGALRGHRPGVERLDAGALQSTHSGTSLPAGPIRLSSKKVLPRLGSRFISSVCAPQ